MSPGQKAEPKEVPLQAGEREEDKTASPVRGGRVGGGSEGWLSALWRRRRWMTLGSLLVAVPLLGVTPGCAVGYLATQGYYQGKLLAGRIPVAEAMQRNDLSPEKKRALTLIQQVRTYGEETLGLSPTQNYTLINLEWKEEIWNITASRELSFTPYTWWFPIVGTVPYKGFFRKPDAEKEAESIRKKDFEVSVRRVAGYSTLGWFKDPILPSMLDYETPELANLILHELAHATVFIPGHIDFNESFASFVGDVSALRFLNATYGADAEVTLEAQARQEDSRIFTQFMHTLYTDLDLVYKDARSDEEKRAAKTVRLAQVPEQFATLPFKSSRYQKRKAPVVNNADLMQYRRYSSAESEFQQVLNSQGGDLQKFFDVFRGVATSGEDPFQALQRLAKRAAPAAEADSSQKSADK